MAVNYLTLRSTLIYTSPGVLAPTGSIYTVSTSGLQTLNTSTIAIGASTNQTLATSGSYANGWVSTLSGLSAIKKITMSPSGQYQLAVQTGSSTINATSNAGMSWTSLTGSNGLPAGAVAYPQATATGSPAYASISQSATGQFLLAAVTGGLLYTSANYGASWSPAGGSLGSPTYSLPFEGSIADAASLTMPLLTGSATYVTGVPLTSAASNGTASTYAVNLVNPAGGSTSNFIRGSLPVMTNFTVSCAVNFQSLPSSGISNIVSIGTSAQTFFNICYVNNVTVNSITYTGIQCQFLNASNASVVVGNYAAVTTNTWYSVSFTFSTTGLCYMLVNGAFVGSVSGATLLNSMTTYAIGNLCHANTQALNGYVDDFRIYNTVPAINAVPPYLYLPFENSRTDSMGNSTGTLTGSVSYVTGAVGSYALSVTNPGAGTSGNVATNYIRYTVPSGMTSITITGWFYSTTTVVNSYPAIFTMYNMAFNLYINPATNQLGFNFPSGSGTGQSVITASFAISTNTWYSFACIYQIGTCYLYVNNVLIGTGTSTGLGSYSSYTSLGICAYDNGTANQPFSGSIDDFRIYNTVVTLSPVVAMNYSHTAVSGTGQYMLAAAANGGLFQSSNYGATWSQVQTTLTSSPWTGLSLSQTGQYMLALGGGTTSPQQSSLASNTWTQTGVTWIASVSSTLTTGYPAYGAFNNYYGSSGVYSWACANGTYTGTGGLYSAAVTTTVQNVGVLSGEWIQLQSSIPLVAYSYSYACGGFNNVPKVGYLLGSNDGTTWYPIQSWTMTTNPLTANFSTCSTSLLVNQSGTQTIQGAVSGSGTFTTYGTATTSAYTYFRVVATSVWVQNALLEFGELFLTFLGGQSYSINYGSTWLPALTYGGDAVNIVKSVNVTSVGGGYYTMPSFTPLSTGITFATWFILGTAPSAYARLFDMAIATNKGSDSDSILLFFSSSQIVCQQIVGAGTRYTMTSPTTLSTATLYHAVWTIDGSGNQVLYLNGVSNATSTRVINVQNYPYFYLGKSNYTADPYPNLSLLDFRMYNRALNSTEVTALYKSNSNATAATWCAVSGNGQFTLLTNSQTAQVVSNYLVGFSNENYVSSVLPGINANINCGSISTTGQYMVLVTVGTTNNVYYSTNYGGMWTGLTVGSAAMTSCAISADGSYLTVSNATTVYTLNLNSTGYSVAIGNQAAILNQAQNAIAIGNQAGLANQAAGSIVLNGSGSTLNAYYPGFYANPVAPYGTSYSPSFALLGYGSDSQVVQSNVTVLANGALSFASNTITRLYSSQTPQYDANWNYYASSIGNTYWNGSSWTSNTDGLNYGCCAIVYGWNNMYFCANFTSGMSSSTITNAQMAASTRMTMLSNGKIGIGTTVPGATLHIIDSTVSSSSFPLTIMSPNLSAGGDQYVLFGTSASSANQAQFGFHYVGDGSTYNYSFIQNYGISNAMCWRANGYVGIGTTRPLSLLTVGTGAAGSITAGGVISVNNTGSAYITAYDGTREAILGADSSGYGFAGCVSNHDFVIRTNNAERIRVTASGSVGIGTNAPTAGLHIKNATSAMRITGSFGNSSNRPAVSTTPGAYEIRSSSSGGDWGDDGFLRLSAGGGTGTTTQSYIDLSGYSTVSDMNQNIILGTSGAERMRIRYDGNVGIGTNGPVYTLHVVGSIYATGDVAAFSDQRYKQNIVRLDRSLEKICQLGGYSYTREDYRSGETQIGLLAQEVMEVFPEAVSHDAINDKYSVNYNCLVAPLVESIKALRDRIDAQDRVIQLLLDRLGPA